MRNSQLLLFIFLSFLCGTRIVDVSVQKCIQVARKAMVFKIYLSGVLSNERFQL